MERVASITVHKAKRGSINHSLYLITFFVGKPLSSTVILLADTSIWLTFSIWRVVSVWSRSKNQWLRRVVMSFVWDAS